MMNNNFRKFILRNENTADEDLNMVGNVGNNVHCELGFKIYSGHKNISIGNNVYLADLLINAGDKTGSVRINDFVFFGHRVMVLARTHDYKKINIERQSTIDEAPISIGEGVWIGSGSIILSGVTIGNNSVIAAGSVVTKDVSENSVYGGIPAKFIKMISFI